MQSLEALIYEKLNDVTSIRGFVISSVAIFEQAVEDLLNRIFLKNDFAVKSVVDSLLYQSGPLFDLTVRLKLLFGLGVISQAVFEDINGFIKLKEQLNNNEQECAFTDPLIVAFLQQLHSYGDRPPEPLEDLNQPQSDSLLAQIKLLRQQKLIRSYLTLAISHIVEQLQIESPL